MAGAIKPAINLRMTPWEWCLLVVLSLVWGLAFFLGEIALQELQPFTIVFARVSLAALTLLAVLKAMGQALPRALSLWAAFLVMGALNNAIPFSLIVWGQTAITGGLASIINATTPIFTVLLAHAFTRDEKLSPGRLAGVLLGLAGVAAMIGPEIEPGALSGLGGQVWGQVAVVGAALMYACAGVFARRFAAQPPLVVATGQLICSSLLILPLALAIDRPWELAPPGAATWGALLGLALPGTALAYIIYFRILATAGATNLLLVTLLVPVSAVLLGMAILGERLDPHHLAGMALIGLGLASIDGRPAAAFAARFGRRARRPSG